jgi:hypothetical protein
MRDTAFRQPAIALFAENALNVEVFSPGSANLFTGRYSVPLLRAVFEPNEEAR